MSMAYEEAANNTEAGLVTEPSVDAPRRSSKLVLVIGGLVALGLVVAGSAVILGNKPQPSNVDGAMSLVTGANCDEMADSCDPGFFNKGKGTPCMSNAKSCDAHTCCQAKDTCGNSAVCPKWWVAKAESSGSYCARDKCDTSSPTAPDTATCCQEQKCESYTCSEGLIKLLGSKALAQNFHDPSDADGKCCAVCPRGWTQLGKTGDEAPGWGLSELGTTAHSVSDCANKCKENDDCVSFKWHPTTKNCIHMKADDSTVEAQTSKWDNVVTCVEAKCATTGKSTAGLHGGAGSSGIVKGDGIPCVFPFRYKGSVYNECTHEHHNNMNPGGSQLDGEKLTTWCATETQDMEAVPEKWGHCSAECGAGGSDDADADADADAEEAKPADDDSDADADDDSDADGAAAAPAADADADADSKL